MTGPAVRETGLSGLVDSLAIRSLVDAYAAAVDNGDGEAFAALFDPDGVIERGPASEISPARVHRGRDDLAAIPGNLAVKYDRTFHFVGNHTSTIDGDGAAGVTYCLAHHLNIDRHGSIDHVMFIRYLDDFRRGSDGQWRFSKRKLVVEWTETRLADPRLPA
jgi:hypothetical protein